MKTLIAFIKKELMAQARGGKVLILGIVFLVFGLMNPAFAKITPWLMELFADSLAQSGMTVTQVEVTALDSWMQYFKNLPLVLIVFVLAEAGIFTREYQTGTLVLSLTKGLKRSRVVWGKGLVLFGLWSLGYLVYFGVTYGYTAYYWDNGVAQNLAFAVLAWWIFGLFVVGLMMLFSVVSKSSTGVLLGTGGVILALTALALIPPVAEYLPTALMEGYSLVSGVSETNSYSASCAVTLGVTAVCMACSLPLFDKKQL